MRQETQSGLTLSPERPKPEWNGSAVAAGRAVLYLRVSTTSQVKTDYDPEGLSIPAQRESCLRKAADMGVSVIDEYVEPGRSATSMDKRPAFQAMLERIKTQQDVDYVIVYKLSRMNRNRIDDAMVLMSLRACKVSLVSATESIDDSPVGQLVHGILASINQFRSDEDGADIKYKMAEKAKRGGTLGRAPLGYKNVREQFEGREVRTVAIDEERAPLIRQAFELYATGEYTLQRLVEVLSERGLRTRPGRYPAGAISDSQLSNLLRDRYYCGIIEFQGNEYQGRHEPLIGFQLFDEVQEILRSRSQAGERQRKHKHHLKGTAWCGQCHDKGTEHRLIMQRAKGRGGVYFYFFCRGRQESLCDQRYMQVDELDDAVLRYYATLKLTDEFKSVVHTHLAELQADEDKSEDMRRDQLRHQLIALERKEENLLDLAEAGNLPSVRIRRRLNRIHEQRAVLEAQLESAGLSLTFGVQIFEAALSLLDDPQEMYRQAGESQRRLLNQALFEKLYVDEGEVVGEVLAEPFSELVQVQRAVVGPQFYLREKEKVAGLTGKARLLAEIFYGRGSSKATMVGVTGIEPVTSAV